MAEPKKRGRHPVRDFLGELFDCLGCLGEGCAAVTVLVALLVPVTFLLLS